MLGLAEISGPKYEEQEARRLVVQAAQERLEEIRRSDASGFAEVYDDLAQHYTHRFASVGGLGQDEGHAHAEHYLQYLDLSRTLLDVERQAVLRLRDEGRVTDETLREMEYELDLDETRLIAATTMPGRTV
jgi:CPA1 family monovalent cation:H+ antiporter